MKNQKISVLMLVYNVADYLEECLNSCISQITDFDFEVVIGEDNSTDGSREICRKFKLLYPEKIKLIENEVNLKFNKNFISTLKNCEGKYIAILDGDDKWIDNFKLQKQYDLISINNYSMVFTNFYESNGKSIYKFYGTLNENKVIKYDDFAKFMVICTSSFLFNAKLMNDAIISFGELAYRWKVLDMPLFLYCSYYENAYHLNEFTTVRNIRDESETITQDLNKKIATIEDIRNIKQYFFDNYHVDQEIITSNNIYFARLYLFVYAEFMDFKNSKEQFQILKRLGNIKLTDYILYFAPKNVFTNLIYKLLKKIYIKLFLDKKN